MKNVDRFLGLPFKMDGRGPRHFDCWGLAKTYIEKFWPELGLPDYLGADVRASIADAMLSDDWVKSETPRNGDIVVMTTPISGGRVAPLHIGVAVSDTHVLHIDEGRFSECLPFNHPLIKIRLHSFWRHKGLA